MAKTSKSFKTGRGNLGGSHKAYNLSRQICIVSSSGTLVNTSLSAIKYKLNDTKDIKK